MNKPHGRWTFFDKKGKISTYFDCYDGTCGDSFSFNKRGQLVKKIIIGKNGLREKSIFYNKKGEIIKEEFHDEK